MSRSPVAAEDEVVQVPAVISTRTVAIIKNHALAHRFDIEPRILEASFEIVKERQMEFDTETDPETLYELFGEDAHSLAECVFFKLLLSLLSGRPFRLISFLPIGAPFGCTSWSDVEPSKSGTLSWVTGIPPSRVRTRPTRCAPCTACPLSRTVSWGPLTYKQQKCKLHLYSRHRPYTRPTNFLTN